MGVATPLAPLGETPAYPSVAARCRRNAFPQGSRVGSGMKAQDPSGLAFCHRRKPLRVKLGPTLVRVASPKGRRLALRCANSTLLSTETAFAPASPLWEKTASALLDCLTAKTASASFTAAAPQYFIRQEQSDSE
ncbi:hypothetical protein A6770_01555 [Nostoc minutum NIES-26]|uniref:Uncharacterized protein n=1 Tax=Nostoc minutum NIES-26 TaxID=1844469 RepID=A0A367R0K7_9NOSO|nr:hypothetical protein A6770_01555 [Nostoc minutum NIES-26]